MPPVDPTKVEALVKKFNDSESIEANKKWFAADGFHALTVFTPTPSPTFNPGNGIPLKVFKNAATGEIRIYDMRSFS